jgi:hypothetical protein
MFVFPVTFSEDGPRREHVLAVLISKEEESRQQQRQGPHESYGKSWLGLGLPVPCPLCIGSRDERLNGEEGIQNHVVHVHLGPPRFKGLEIPFCLPHSFYP